MSENASNTNTLESLPGMTPALLARVRRNYGSYENLRDWALADPDGTAYTLNISEKRLRMWVPDAAAVTL